MNLLRGVKVYLGGPVEASLDPNNWRNSITTILEKMEMIVLNPLVKPTWMPPVDGVRQNELKHILSQRGVTPSTISHDTITIENDAARRYCLSLVRAADILIINISHKTFSVGTWEEVTLARDKPIFVICEDDIPSMWLYSMLGISSHIERERYFKRDVNSVLSEFSVINDLHISNLEMTYFTTNDLFKWIFLTYNK